MYSILYIRYGVIVNTKLFWTCSVVVMFGNGYDAAWILGEYTQENTVHCNCKQQNDDICNKMMKCDRLKCDLTEKE